MARTCWACGRLIAARDNRCRRCGIPVASGSYLLWLGGAAVLVLLLTLVRLLI
jgi:hypothetical protein